MQKIAESSINAPVYRLERFLDKVLETKSNLRILEAGCGSAHHFRFKQKIYMTGIDSSPKQLQRNVSLNEAVVGDIQYYDFQPSTFDVIICWNVLEHVPQPELALYKFASAVKPGGLIVLGLPNLWSLKGIAAKFLPHSFHVWIYRYLYGKSNAGEEDVGPFKTYLKFTVAPNAVKKFAVYAGLQVVYLEIYDATEVSYFLQRSRINRLTRSAYNMARIISKFASLGKFSDSEFIIVLKK